MIFVLEIRCFSFSSALFLRDVALISCSVALKMVLTSDKGLPVTNGLAAQVKSQEQVGEQSVKSCADPPANRSEVGSLFVL